MGGGGVFSHQVARVGIEPFRRAISGYLLARLSLLKLSLSLSSSSSLLLVRLPFLSCLLVLSCRSLLLMLSLRSRTKLFFLFIASAKVTANCQVECQLSACPSRNLPWTLPYVAYSDLCSTNRSTRRLGGGTTRCKEQNSNILSQAS